jgi:hypothetical protein
MVRKTPDLRGQGNEHIVSPTFAVTELGVNLSPSYESSVAVAIAKQLFDVLLQHLWSGWRPEHCLLLRMLLFGCAPAQTEEPTKA